MRQLLFIFLLCAAGATACGVPTATPPASPPPRAATALNPTPAGGQAVPRAVTTVGATATAPATNAPTARPTDSTAAQPTTLPTGRPSDVPTATFFPTAAPTSAQLIQLLDDGCCASPAWYSDSETVLFIDKPDANAPTGMYAVNVNTPNKRVLWSELIAFYTREFDYAQIPEQAGTRLIRIQPTGASAGKEIRIKNGGRSVSLSPDRTQMVWTETRDTFPIENRVSNIMLAALDFDGAGAGTPKRLTQVLRGGVSGWLDNHRLLLNGRLSRETNDSTTFVYDLTTGTSTTLFTAERSRLSTLSRDGSRLAYAIVNDADATRNGLWVIRTDGTGATKLDMFGAAQWRDDSHLVIAPFEMDAPSHAFYEYDANAGTLRRLTPPEMPFKIASGDWAISPDGEKIVFVNAADNNLWLWRFAN